MRYYYWLIVPLFMIMILLPHHTSYADSGKTYHDVMAVHLSDSEKTLTFNIGYNPEADNFFDWSHEDVKDLLPMLKLKDEEIQVAIDVLDTAYVNEDSLEYDKSIVWTEEGRLIGEIWFSSPYLKCERTYIEYPYYIPNPMQKIETVKVLTTKKGFHPSKNNVVTIYACNNVKNIQQYYDMDVSCYIQLRVINREGKCVYKGKFDETENIIDYEEKHAICHVTWNGKPSKKNEAKLNHKKYIPDGMYTVEATSVVKYGDVILQSEPVTDKLKVNSKAPKGYAGQKKAERIPIYTGDASVDYLAEKICKAAGVKFSMSDDKKIKKIYTYMVKNFKHMHTYKGRKKYYKTNKLKSQIKAYKTKSDKKYKNREIIYKYIDTSGIKQAMEYRGGVCDHNAAIFMILCNHVGVVSYRCGGYYVNSNGSYSPHAWAFAVVDGKIYYYDVDVEIQNYRKGQKNYYWYRKTFKQASKNHEIVVSNY